MIVFMQTGHNTCISKTPSVKGGFSMGLAASQFRLLLLVKRKNDLEFKMEIIDEARMRLANASGQLAAMMSTSLNAMDPNNNPAAQMLQAELQVIASTDSILEMEQKQLDTQHQAVETEIEGVQKVIQKNVDMGFKIFANG